MDTDPLEILRQTKRITVVGASADPAKDAHDVPRSMLHLGFDVVPVNPRAKEIFGRAAYARLEDAPKPLGIVNVFRPGEEAAEIAREAIRLGAAAVWLQTGIRSEEARRLAREAGMPFVENRCIRTVYQMQ